tara:strand:+ start:102 stop:509 length:408 start_codon:yes stop_codon:yes gene_type:complete
MKLLKAKDRVTCTHKPLNGITPNVVEVPLKDLMLTTDFNWMMKRYPDFKKSMDSAGMKYPIIYTKLEHYWLPDERWPKDEKGNCIKGIAVHTGNKRVYWAKQNGYTHIEGYYVESKEEQAAIVRQTFLTKGQFPK